jgi:hypothetical protein
MLLVMNASARNWNLNVASLILLIFSWLLCFSNYSRKSYHSTHSSMKSLFWASGALLVGVTKKLDRSADPWDPKFIYFQNQNLDFVPLFFDLNTILIIMTAAASYSRRWRRYVFIWITSVCEVSILKFDLVVCPWLTNRSALCRFLLLSILGCVIFVAIGLVAGVAMYACLVLMLHVCLLQLTWHTSAACVSCSRHSATFILYVYLFLLTADICHYYCLRHCSLILMSVHCNPHCNALKPTIGVAGTLTRDSGCRGVTVLSKESWFIWLQHLSIDCLLSQAAAMTVAVWLSTSGAMY